jgi:hypothetical protein
MSYDIDLTEPTTGNVIVFPENHPFRGGTYAIGGTPEASLNITYNYSPHYRQTIDAEQGIRWLYGKTGAEALPVLKKAVAQLGTDQHSDYWEPTPGNAGHALLGLIAFAELRPDGVFAGD